jgi:hypothetical protein
MVNINVFLLVLFSFLQKPANYSPIPKWDQTTQMLLVPLCDAAHVILSAAKEENAAEALVHKQQLRSLVYCAAKSFEGMTPPARACFAVKTLPKNALVEIEAIAVL